MKRILFIQSQTFYGADSAIHAQLMEHLDRHKVEVSVACNHRCDANREMTVLDRLKKIPSLTVRPTEFGPTVFGRPLLEKLLQSMTHGQTISCQRVWSIFSPSGVL